MGLTIGVRIGDVVDIGERWIALLSVDSRIRATLITNDGEKATVSAIYETEMAPEIWVRLCPDPGKVRLRLKFEAPRHIAITRRPAQIAEPGTWPLHTVKTPPHGDIIASDTGRRGGIHEDQAEED